MTIGVPPGGMIGSLIESLPPDANRLNALSDTSWNVSPGAASPPQPATMLIRDVLAGSGPEAYGLAGSWSASGAPGAIPGLGREPSAEARYPVLLVDDDRAIRDSLRMVLEDSGYTVVEACDGVEAMGVLRGARHAMVVLLDIMMPRMTGEAVVGEIARDPKLQAGSAVVVITANRHSLSTAFRRQLESMGIPILDKPPDIDDLVAHVAHAEQRLSAER